MNVFVLSTGRCGTTTFANACKLMTNFTAEHESERRRHYGKFVDRYQELQYPKNHIEVDNRLSWFLGRLEEIYGKDAYYVHLLREREEVARSFLNRWKQRKTNIIFSFAWGILTHPYEQVEQLSEDDRIKIGRQYYDTVNGNIQSFLNDKPMQSTLWLDDIKSGFELFWHRIGAEGDIESALNTWDTCYNEGVNAPKDIVNPDQIGDSLTLDNNRSISISVNIPIGEEDNALPESGSVSAGSENSLRPNSILIEKNQSNIKCALSAAENLKATQMLPPFEVGKWTLTPESIRFIASLVIQSKPEHIVEFGSRLSIKVLRWGASQLSQPSRITSIDHDPEYMRLTESSIKLDSSNVNTSFVLAPLVVRNIAGSNLPVHHVPHYEFAQYGKADLVLIDGPPSALGGREGMLYQAMDCARPGTLVLLDDANRNMEKDAIRQWSKVFGDKIHVDMLTGFPKGLAAITIIEPITQEQLPLCAISPATRRLLNLISADTTWIVVDDNMSEAAVFENLSILPYTERNGEYWGRPKDDEHAITELERLRELGARYIAFISHSFWWLDYFTGLKEYLGSKYVLTLDDEDLVVYDLSNGKN